MNTLHADIELFIVDFCEKTGVEVHNVRFEIKYINSLIQNGVIKLLPEKRKVLSVSFDLLILEDKLKSIEFIINTIEEYISGLVEFHYVSGNYYIIHNKENT